MSTIWIDAPDCPRCGKPLKPVFEDKHGTWVCDGHETGEKSIWFDWELTQILRSRAKNALTAEQARRLEAFMRGVALTLRNGDSEFAVKKQALLASVADINLGGDK